MCAHRFGPTVIRSSVDSHVYVIIHCDNAASTCGNMDLHSLLYPATHLFGGAGTYTDAARRPQRERSYAVRHCASRVIESIWNQE